jgi:hypothetical protein
VAKPSCPASELRDTTGKATLMLWAVTPRVEVLAELTGDGFAPEDPLVDALPVDDVLDGELDPQAAVPTRTNPTTARARNGPVRLCRTQRFEGRAVSSRGCHRLLGLMAFAPFAGTPVIESR